MPQKASEPKPKKQKFSSFRYKTALKYLNIENLIDWTIDAPPTPATPFFKQRLDRLEQCFDLQSYERSRELLIDAFCEEALITCENLKIWKGAALESQDLIGQADYLLTQRRGYVEAPLLCVVEAKKDDFEQGAAQCLVEMKACQWNNQQANSTLNHPIDIYGIVTNGEGWKFYCLTTENQVLETHLYSLQDLDRILSTLHHVFHCCQKNLAKIPI